MFIQFNSSGNICATVTTAGPAPVCANQISVPDDTNLDGMMVDTANLVLIPIPVSN